MIRTTDWHPVRGERNAVYAHAQGGGRLLRMTLRVDRVREDGVAIGEPEYAWADSYDGLFRAALPPRPPGEVDDRELALPPHGPWTEIDQPSWPMWLDRAREDNGGMSELEAAEWLGAALIGEMRHMDKGDK
jgi:hypothetical protein